tara:strand:+ start:339 stop:758 length:420 start_codon:yes stop_codon:yes gene_type:complete
VAYKQYYFPIYYKATSGDWIEIDFLQYGEVAGLSAEDKTIWDTDLQTWVDYEQAMIAAGTYGPIPDPATNKWSTANVTVNGSSYYPARMYTVTSDVVDPFANFINGETDFFSKWQAIMLADENCFWPTMNHIRPASDAV